jgi:hypothetical protein
MAQVLIRNVPEDVIAAHRKRANAHGRSLAQELRNVIERAAPYSPQERLAGALRFQGQTPPGPRSDPVELIREDRNVERNRCGCKRSALLAREGRANDNRKQSHRRWRES